MTMATNGTANEKTYFEQQRELLLNDVASVCDDLSMPGLPQR